MGSVDLVDGRAFKVDFSGNGVAKLREKVKEKLKEFMGDYTDDTLVDYIIVLLRNGRQKEEARSELNVFLGDDSHSFVSWLWDHLTSNLHLYGDAEASYTDEVPKINPTIVEQCERTDSQQVQSDSERGAFSKLPRSRHNREWKGLMRDVDEPPPLLSSKIENIQPEQKMHSGVSHRTRSVSPQVSPHRKRNRSDKHPNIKTEAVSQSRMAAPRRLLQFAVRDAVAASNTESEPSPKRLRSVVSSSTVDLPKVRRPQRLQSIARISNPMATVIKAVAEAAEDVTRVKSLSVFDRLGRDMSELEPAGYGETDVGDRDYGLKPHMSDERGMTYVQRNQSGQLVHTMPMMEEETGLVYDHSSGSEGFDDVNMMGNVTKSGTSSADRSRNFLGEYSVAENDFNGMWKTQNMENDQQAVSRNSSHKLLNAPVNFNDSKQSHHLESKKIEGLDSRKLIQASRVGDKKSEAPGVQENGIPVTVGNGNANPISGSQDSQKPVASATGPLSITRHLEDADSRTIFVSNVHFAATKDSLSRHFNKFAEVLKVIIITDPTTGQPTGSAYVEFMRKESADNALSLNGTSFMSRILKVVKKSAAHKEMASIMPWPHIARGSPFPATRYARAPFPRGSPAAAFRPRPHPMKPGSRSFQWKRDGQTSLTDSAVPVSGGTGPGPLQTTSRSLIYVRPETKPDGNSGIA